MGFSRFGITHLSPSSLNLWRDTPGLWCLRYLASIRDEGSPAMWRGSAVERGLEMILRGKSDEALPEAMRQFEASAQGELSDAIDAEAKLIPGMVKQCALWREDMCAAGNGRDVAATQLKVSTFLDGVSVPVIGYVDFTFIEGADVDLKTTKACPSKPRPDHLRQIALYKRARGRDGALLYVTDKKHAFFAPSPSELADALAELTDAARSLQRFLTHIPDANAAILMMPHPTDHYAYGDAAKAKVMELVA